MKKIILIFFIAIAIFLVGGSIFVYTQRNEFIGKIVEPKLKKFSLEKNVDINYSKIEMVDLHRISISDLYVKQNDADTFSTVKKIDFNFSLKSLLRKKLVITNLSLDSVFISAKIINKKRNFEFLSKKENINNLKIDTIKHTRNYSLIFSKSLNLFFDIFPDDVSISNININLQKDSLWVSSFSEKLEVRNHKVCSEIYLKTKDYSQTVSLDGTFIGSERKGVCKIFSKKENCVSLPYVKNKIDADVSFDTLSFSFNENYNSDDLVKISGTLKFDSLKLNWFRLSDTTVCIDKYYADYKFNIFPSSVELDSLSLLTLNELSLVPYVKCDFSSNIHLKVRLFQNKFKSQNLFNSLPKGLFKNLEGISTEGSLSYLFSLDLDMANIDSLKFHSELKKHDDFKIIKYGATNFSEMESPFIYNAYEDDKLVKSFSVSDSYNNFRKLDDISSYLQAAVLYSEDGYFYAHKGFLETALTSSMIRNIKEKRFVRGGSTISMQLVKNLYLSRQKTLTRKVEEALIVWLIENNRLVSKKRMYEVYLNIIEWGPAIYGANEASQFYFSKDASQLTPSEAIFMSSIIPRPKKFMWYFDKQHKLKDFVEAHYKLVGDRMLKHNVITEEQYSQLSTDIEITGVAKKYLPKKDDVEVDIYEEEDD